MYSSADRRTCTYLHSIKDRLTGAPAGVDALSTFRQAARSVSFRRRRSYRSYRIYLSTHHVTMLHTLLSRSYGTLACF